MKFPAISQIKFNRQEFAGAFGGIGTDFPLLVGLILSAKLDSTSVLVMFGLMQIFTGLVYGLPMPVQPLKAMAALVIAQKLSGDVIYGAGLAIGIIMLTLTLTGLVEWLNRVIPKSVVRGIQFGLGLQLASLALKDYICSDGILGYGLTILAAIIILFLRENRHYPAAILVILLGIVYALLFKMDSLSLVKSLGFNLPQFHLPRSADVITGFIILALPQIPLSLSNSILATKQISQDFFPEKPLTIRKIGFTYSLMNLINPFFGGIPTCHGSGGMVGHYIFGGRTGGSVIIYGSLYLFLGLFLSQGFHQVINIFPLPMLGAILLFESLALLVLIRDTAEVKTDFTIAILVGLIASSMRYGYVISLVLGAIMAHLAKKYKLLDKKD